MAPKEEVHYVVRSVIEKVTKTIYEPKYDSRRNAIESGTTERVVEEVGNFTVKGSNLNFALDRAGRHLGLMKETEHPDVLAADNG